MVEKKIKAQKKVEVSDVKHDHDHNHEHSHDGYDHSHDHNHDGHEHTHSNINKVAKPTSGAGPLQEGDFVEIDYSGWLKDDNTLFDTTSRALAEQNGIKKDKIAYGPVTIKIGRHQILKAIDGALVGKNVGETVKLDLSPEQAFGKKDPKLVQLVSTAKFTKEGIRPFAGLTVSIDGMNGIIRAISGGRTIVDFNHPLSSKDVKYEITIKRKVTNQDEQIKSYLDGQMNLDAQVKTEDGKTVIKTKQDIPKELHELLIKAVKDNVSEELNIEFQKL